VFVLSDLSTLHLALIAAANLCVCVELRLGSPSGFIMAAKLRVCVLSYVLAVSLDLWFRFTYCTLWVVNEDRSTQAKVKSPQAPRHCERDLPPHAPCHKEGEQPIPMRPDAEKVNYLPPRIPCPSSQGKAQTLQLRNGDETAGKHSSLNAIGVCGGR
jgi:hypothetical protein